MRDNLNTIIYKLILCIATIATHQWRWHHSIVVITSVTLWLVLIFFIQVWLCVTATVSPFF